MLRPLAYPLFALIAGIFLGSFSDFELLPFLAGALVIILGGIFLTRRKQWHRASLLLIISFAFVFGLANMQKQMYFPRSDKHISNFIAEGKITLEGTVSENPDIYPDRNSLTVKCIRIINEERQYVPAEGNIRLILPPDSIFEYGDLIRFQTILKKNRGFKNPGGFDYERHLKLRGIAATGHIADNSRIVLLRKNTASAARAYLEDFRTNLRNIIRQNAATPEREIVTALTIGEQNEIPPDIRDNFSKTGTAHILSISGFHIGIVAGAAFFIISLILRRSEYLLLRFSLHKISAAAAFAMVVLYSLIAGMGVTVLRSALMTLVFLGSLLFSRQRDLYNSLALSALVILAISPEALFDISFQLSFAAVFSILFITPRLTFSFAAIAGWPLWLQSSIRHIYLLAAVSLAATIGTLPLIISYFNRISLITILANLIVAPLLGILSLSMGMAFILSALFSSALAGLFVKIAAFFVHISAMIINKLAALSWSSVSIGGISLMEIIAFYALLLILMKLIDARKKESGKDSPALKISLMRTAILLIVLFIAADRIRLYIQDRYTSDLRITAIDVGQGDSTLVRFPGGQKMLIDGGGFAESTFDMGKMVVAPFLYSERISAIDIVVLTHPHPDHYQGLIYILDNFNVREFWHNGQASPEDESYNQLSAIVARRKIKTEILTAASLPKTIGGAAIKILWPEKTPQRDSSMCTHEAVNDASLVMKIKYGKMGFLLTGDISARVEQAIMKAEKDLQVDVLFVPHHGSLHASSGEFIAGIAARYAVASAGQGNVFRHPHPSVLKRYQKANTEIFRTDQDGAITFVTDGISLTKDTFIKNRPEK